MLFLPVTTHINGFSFVKQHDLVNCRNLNGTHWEAKRKVTSQCVGTHISEVLSSLLNNNCSKETETNLGNMWLLSIVYKLLQQVVGFISL